MIFDLLYGDLFSMIVEAVVLFKRTPDSSTLILIFWTCPLRSINLLTSSSSSENLSKFIVMSWFTKAKFSKCFLQNYKSSSNLLFTLFRFSVSAVKAATSFLPSSLWLILVFSVCYAWANNLLVSLFFITSAWVAFW